MKSIRHQIMKTTSLSTPIRNQGASLLGNTSMPRLSFPPCYKAGHIAKKSVCTFVAEHDHGSTIPSYASPVPAYASPEPAIHSLYEQKTGTWQYIVADPSSKTAVIIDPVLDFDSCSQVIKSHTADSLLALIKEHGYKVDRILETHAHADHITAASYLQDRLTQLQGHRPPICIGHRIVQVQKTFGNIYGISEEDYDGVFDKLLKDDESFNVGELEATAIHLPGHTPDHLGYKIGGTIRSWQRNSMPILTNERATDNVFCGDSLFHSDIGTARCDFPGGSANDLYESARKLLALPEDTKIWTGHDYPSGPRGEPVPWLSVKDHKERNLHLKEGTSKGDFVALRQTRDAGLSEPKLLHQSLQVNIRAGRFPKPTASGHSLLHLPLKLDNMAWKST
ncbi:unnamed protein product [Discula destructiva]